MAQSDVRVSRSFIYIARYVSGLILKWKYNIKVTNVEQLKKLKPPYLILSNHFNTFDPFIISAAAPRHIRWVASDTLFRNRYLRFLMKRLVGSISKSKSKSDLYTIRKIAEAVREDGVVGIFPEGQRSWDGQTLPLMYATAKLVRMLKAPVVFCVLEGGYHSLPRWSKKRRRGQLTVAFQDPWKPEEFKGLSVDEIFQEMTKRLDYDEYDYQRKHRIIFRSKRRSEYLEHVLYVCPRCTSITTLVSRGNIYYCSKCGLMSELDIYGFFTFDDPSIEIKSVPEWNSWQRDYLRNQFRKKAYGLEEVIFSDDRVAQFTGYRDRRMLKKGLSWIGFTPTGIQVKDSEGSHWYKFENLDSLVVSLQRNFEFYTKDTLYLFRFPGPRSSAYKYLSAYECLTEVTGLEDKNI